MTAAVGQLTGQNPAYTPDDRPIRVFRTSPGEFSAMRPRHIPGVRWAQSGLLIAAVAGICYETDYGNRSPRSATGYPIAWADGEGWYEYTSSGRQIFARPDPFQFGGHNLAVPVCWIVAALCLPPLVVNAIRWLRGRPATPTEGRRNWVAGALLLAAVSGLVMAGVESETLTGGKKKNRIVTPFFAQPPGSWLDGTSSVTWLRDEASRMRWQLFGNLPYGRQGIELRWWFATRMTVVGMILGGLFGVLIFQPRRRPVPAPPAVPHTPDTAQP
jgi:hypothetical protein